MSPTNINIEGVSLVEFFGVNNARFHLLKRHFPRLKISAKGHRLSVQGNEQEVDQFEIVVNDLMGYLHKYGHISQGNFENMLASGDIAFPEIKVETDVIVYGARGNKIKARTKNQKLLVRKVEENDVVFAVGPAGTGKTYTAVALAVRALKNKLVNKIILTRPAVEAGESLGFLPGDLKDKIDPYLRPLYDALDDMIPPQKLGYHMSNRVIEIAPLAYMRGRTLNNAFIILDEAQNATKGQLKMFLTRLGPSAKCIITGDMTQVDLPRNVQSGLGSTINILKKIKEIGIVRLTKDDVVRHKLVKKIIKAFEDNEEMKQLPSIRELDET